MVFAYFSAEFGLTECMPNYAGGLGILAGDHLKSASDAGLPLVGVGLLYQRGYFQQYLNADGWQQETYPVNDFATLPLVPEMDAAEQPAHHIAWSFLDAWLMRGSGKRKWAGSHYTC